MLFWNFGIHLPEYAVPQPRPHHKSHRRENLEFYTVPGLMEPMKTLSEWNIEVLNTATGNLQRSITL
jgi:hypothetical protein